jgi:ribosome-associated protein
MASTKKTQAQQLLAVAVAACEDKKAEDIRILALDPSESGLTDYFLICTGLSDRQNVAITDEIEIRLKRDFGTYPNSVEGRRQGEWILMDYVDFIVHVFSAEKRAFYGLERLRKSATVLSIDELNAQLKSQLKAAIAPGRTAGGGTKKKVVAKKKSPSSMVAAKKTVAVKKAVAKQTSKQKAIAKKTVAKSAAKKTAAKKSIRTRSAR